MMSHAKFAEINFANSFDANSLEKSEHGRETQIGTGWCFPAAGQVQVFSALVLRTGMCGAVEGPAV